MEFGLLHFIQMVIDTCWMDCYSRCTFFNIISYYISHIWAVGRCCLDGYGAQGVVWSNPDTGKATARYLCIRPNYSATLPGRWKCWKNEARIVICKWSNKSLLRTQGRGFESREDPSAFHVFNFLLMTVQCSVPILKPVACKLCKMWQILHDQALKIVADFSLLFDCRPSPSEI